MFRVPASRSLLQSLRSSSNPARPALTSNSATPQRQLTSKLCTSSSRRPRILAVATQQVLRQRYATRGWEHDAEHEKKFGEKKITPHPELVSSTSSVHSLFHEVGSDDKRKDDTDMTAGIKGDINTIKETFNLSEVPRQAYVLGLAGLLPYLGTSLSTVYCAWEINRAHSHGIGILMNEEQATYALHILETLQIGYGAVIISFLGAIHWGLEWAGFGGYQGYSRYAIGVIAPAIAWPTTLLPHTYALITQFLAFNWLYYTDARATRRGWTPPWYGVYRFVLTFVVGASIIVSLIGRGRIAEHKSTMLKPADRISGLHETYEEALKTEEKARTAKLAKKGKAKSVEPEVDSLEELEDDSGKDEKEGGEGDKKGKESGKGGEEEQDEESEGGDGEDKEDKKEDKSDENEEKSDDKEEKSDDQEEKSDDKKKEKSDSKDEKEKSDKKDKKDKKDDKDQGADSEDSEAKGDESGDAENDKGDDKKEDAKEEKKDKKGKK